LKWDSFISRKGGANNTLAPIKTTGNAIVPSIPSLTHQQDLVRSPRLDAIPSKNHDEHRRDHRSLSPMIEKHQQTGQSPTSNINGHEHEQQSSSPRAEEQQKHKIDEPHVKQQQQSSQHDKNVLKGKPIIFVGGGPGKIVHVQNGSSKS
jgi:hypothetical protein